MSYDLHDDGQNFTGAAVPFRTTSRHHTDWLWPQNDAPSLSDKIYFNQEHMLATQCLEEEEVTILECCGLPAAKVLNKTK